MKIKAIARDYYNEMIVPLTKKETWFAGFLYIGLAGSVSLVIQILRALVGDVISTDTFVSGFESAILSGGLCIMLILWSQKREKKE